MDQDPKEGGFSYNIIVMKIPKSSTLWSPLAPLEQMGVKEAVRASEKEERWMSQSQYPGRSPVFTPTGYLTLEKTHVSLKSIHSSYELLS